MFSKLVYKITLVLATLAVAASFAPTQPTTTRAARSSFLTATVKEAAAITDFMAKAHEEKIQAMGRVEAKYKDQIAELKAKVQELEGPSTAHGATSANSYAFPATNKSLTEKVQAYRTFISKYIINAQAEKQKAVKESEAKASAKYEAIIEAM
jgi:hypothetical protein